MPARIFSARSSGIKFGFETSFPIPLMCFRPGTFCGLPFFSVEKALLRHSSQILLLIFRTLAI